jgi:hypothetical protein
LLFLAIFTAAAVGLAAISASAISAATTATAKTLLISTKKLPKLGTILVNSQGRTLYMFVPDKHKKVTCVAACAAIWPPVKLAKGAKPVAKGPAKASLLGSDPDPAGGPGRHLCRLAAVHLRRRHETRHCQGTGAQPQRRPLVRARSLRQGDSHEALTRHDQ